MKKKVYISYNIFDTHSFSNPTDSFMFESAETSFVATISIIFLFYIDL